MIKYSSETRNKFRDFFSLRSLDMEIIPIRNTEFRGGYCIIHSLNNFYEDINERVYSPDTVRATLVKSRRDIKWLWINYILFKFNLFDLEFLIPTGLYQLKIINLEEPSQYVILDNFLINETNQEIGELTCKFLPQHFKDVQLHGAGVDG